MNWYSEIQHLYSVMLQRSRLLGMVNGRLQGCNTATLVHTYKSFIRPLVDYRALCLTQAPHSLITRLQKCENRILRRCLRVSRFHPSTEVYKLAKITPITTRLCHLQKKFVARTINSDNVPAQQTLLTLCRVLRRKPAAKLPLPSAVLLSEADDLPDNYGEILNETPLAIRMRRWEPP